MADVQLQLGDQIGAISSLERAAELAKDTEFEFFRNDALEKLKEIQSNNETPSNSARKPIPIWVWFLVGLIIIVLIAQL